MNIFKINTSAWQEEDFYLMTSLTEEKIKKVIQPMVEYERENEMMYDNEEYLNALQEKYPRSVIEMHQYIELIQF
jgi:hypothetical protein